MLALHLLAASIRGLGGSCVIFAHSFLREIVAMNSPTVRRVAAKSLPGCTWINIPVIDTLDVVTVSRSELFKFGKMMRTASPGPNKPRGEADLMVVMSDKQLGEHILQLAFRSPALLAKTMPILAKDRKRRQKRQTHFQETFWLRVNWFKNLIKDMSEGDCKKTRLGKLATKTIDRLEKKVIPSVYVPQPRNTKKHDEKLKKVLKEIDSIYKQSSRLKACMP